MGDNYNGNDIDKMREDYLNIEVPHEIDLYIESGIRRARVSRRNRYLAPLAAAVIFGIIMLMYPAKSSLLMNKSASTREGASMKLSEGIKEQLPTIGSYDNLQKLLDNITNSPNDGIMSVDGAVNGTSMKSAESAKNKDSDKRAFSSFNDSISQFSNYSTTNVQVEGVDEADMVKTDGKYIYKVNSDKVVIISAYPAEEMKVVNEIAFDSKSFSPNEIFLKGDYLIVIGNEDYGRSINGPNLPGMVYEGNPKVIIYNIADKSKITKVREISIEGRYVSSRLIDSNLYLVGNKYIPVVKQGTNADINTMLPHYSDSFGNVDNKAIGFNNIQYCPEAVEPSYIVVASLDLDKLDNEVKVSAFLGAANNMYVSENNLYVSSCNYNYGVCSTSIYKFILNKGNVDFYAKGNVPGTTINQFSMDEDNKYFRIATTSNGNFTNGESNNIYVLDENMKLTGKIEGIAPGEKIYSTRFIGDRVYMVTFQNTDPLFVIDLKDVKKPKILGELKIPGFSDYLQPYDENHLIGFGKDTEEVNTGKGSSKPSWAMTKGMKLAIFDVTDVNNPKQQFVTTIGERGTSSDLLFDHKALLFDKNKNLLAFPVTVMNNDGNTFEFQGAYVYNINLKDGFQLKAKISHEDFLNKTVNSQDNGNYDVQRVIYINNILYTLSNGGIKANSLRDLKEVNRLKINN